MLEQRYGDDWGHDEDDEVPPGLEVDGLEGDRPPETLRQVVRRMERAAEQAGSVLLGAR